MNAVVMALPFLFWFHSNKNRKVEMGKTGYFFEKMKEIPNTNTEPFV